MALTNLTFGDGNNKALLCSLHEFMQVLVKQLYSNSEDLKQVCNFFIFYFYIKQIIREPSTVHHVKLGYGIVAASDWDKLKSQSSLWFQ